MESTGPTELWEDDLAGRIQNEYDPMVPNNYEMIVKQKRAEERSRDNEVSSSLLLAHNIVMSYESRHAQVRG